MRLYKLSGSMTVEAVLIVSFIILLIGSTMKFCLEEYQWVVREGENHCFSEYSPIIIKHKMELGEEIWEEIKNGD